MIHVINREITKILLPKFGRTIHKGDRGKTLVITGSSGMLGAALLSAKAVLKSGSGITYLAVDYRHSGMININYPEMVIVPFFYSYKKILKNNNFDAVILGMGLKPNIFNLHRVKDLLLFLSYYYPGQKVVLDAGAIMALKKINKPLNLDLVITPHLKEMSRLIRKPLAKINQNCWQVSQQVSKKYQTTVVLKSYQSYIVKDQQQYLNNSGTEALARGGSGDILSGIIGSLMAQGLTGLQAAVAGNYLHAICGRIASQQKSLESISPMDIVNALSLAFNFVKK